MKRTIRMTLEVTFEDQNQQAREQAALNMECPVMEVPGAADVNPDDLAELVAGSIPINDELLGGSGMFINITDARAVFAGNAP